MRTKLSFDVDLSRSLMLCWLGVLVLYVLLSWIFVLLTHSSYGHVWFLYCTAFLFCLSIFWWAAHISFINWHHWLLRNDDIIEIDISLLHLELLFFEIFAWLTSDLMSNMWPLCISLIINRYLSLPEVKVCLSYLFDLFFNLFLVVYSFTVRISLIDGFSSLLV